MEGDRIDDAELEERNLEGTAEDGGGSLGGVPVKPKSDFSEVDYEMEEGEILEDDGSVDFVNEDSDKSKKNWQSDIEFGEIKTNGCDDFNMVCSDPPRSISTYIFFLYQFWF